MSGVTQRVGRRIARDFDADEVEEVLRVVSAASGTERVQAAVVLAAAGDLEQVHAGARFAALDWRDVLVNGGLAHEGWQQRMDVELGPPDATA
jgi:hypothetical protein